MKKNIFCRLLTFDRLETLFSEKRHGLRWNCPFVLPFWLRTWYSVFGEKFSPYLLGITSGESLLGIAPLMLHADTALFMGSESVCDFQDMVVRQETSELFLTTLLIHLQKENISTLDLGALAPGSQTLKLLPGICRKLGLPYLSESADDMSVMNLPQSWDGYLQSLSGKQRHEIRRKLRRLQEAGEVSYTVTKDLAKNAQVFFHFMEMFRTSRDDKAHFLTPKMQEYFEKLAEELSDYGMLRLGSLAIDAKPIATTFGFEYEKNVFLYNNGYLPRYSSLSAGLLSKVFSLKDGIETGMISYNFLKGDEKYKKYLGGKTVSLMRLTIQLKNT